MATRTDEHDERSVARDVRLNVLIAWRSDKMRRGVRENELPSQYELRMLAREKDVTRSPLLKSSPGVARWAVEIAALLEPIVPRTAIEFEGPEAADAVFAQLQNRLVAEPDEVVPVEIIGPVWSDGSQIADRLADRMERELQMVRVDHHGPSAEWEPPRMEAPYVAVLHDPEPPPNPFRASGPAVWIAISRNPVWPGALRVLLPAAIAMGPKISDVVTETYRELNPAAREAFRFLGVADGRPVHVDLADRLFAQLSQPEQATTALTALTDNAVVQRSGPWIEMHPTLGRLAAERLAAEETRAKQEDLRTALRRFEYRRGQEPESAAISDRWTDEDQLAYRSYADAIRSFLVNARTRPPLTIGIKAPWGAGKTSLMRMVQKELDPVVGRKDGEDVRRGIELREETPDGTRRRFWRRSPETSLRTDEVLAEARRAGATPPELLADPEGGGPDPLKDWRPTVWFNPWVYQNGEQVWAGLAHEIIEQVTGRLSVRDRERFWLRLNLARVDRAAVRRHCYRVAFRSLLPIAAVWLGGLIVAGVLLGITLLAGSLGELVRNTAAIALGTGTVGALSALAVQFVRALSRPVPGAVSSLMRPPDLVTTTTSGLGQLGGVAPGLVLTDPGYASRLGFLHLVHLDLRRVLRLVAREDRPLVVFVDDLDRCSPGTVAQVIEAVNLFLAGELPNCVFVLGMEPDAVAAHVEVAYKDLADVPVRGRTGGSTLGWRFLDKIVQLPVSLPLPDAERDVPDFLANVLGTAPPRSSTAVPGQPPAPTRASGPAVDASVPAPGMPRRPLDAALVDRLEAAIRRRSPDDTSLRAASSHAQLEVQGVDGDLSPEAREAEERVWRDLPHDDGVEAIAARTLPLLRSTNPRELKRFVNLLRFYTVITRHQERRGLPAADAREIAKLAVFAIRWPHLIAPLSVRHDDGIPYLHLLELAADDDDAWSAALDTALDCATDQHADLRHFLAASTPIGLTAAALL